MNKERELLIKAVEWMHELKYVWANVRDSGDYDLLELIEDINKIEQLLVQPEQDLREDLREGISLRDQFAGLAMQGMTDPQPKFYSADDIDDVAELAYKQADAMLAEREKRDDL